MTREFQEERESPETMERPETMVLLDERGIQAPLVPPAVTAHPERMDQWGIREEKESQVRESNKERMYNA